jgi:hypothetical protein
LHLLFRVTVSVRAGVIAGSAAHVAQLSLRLVAPAQAFALFCDHPVPLAQHAH